MINATFEWFLPHNPNWWKIYEKSGKTPFAYKIWQLQIYRERILFGFRFQFNDHSGLYTSISLFRFTFEFNFYDYRQWDDVNDCWMTPDPLAH